MLPPTVETPDHPTSTHRPGRLRGAGLPDLLRSDLAGRAWTTAAFLLIFAGYAVWLGSRFLNVGARLLDLHQNIPIILLGFAVLATLVAGQFDLSVASMSTLAAFLAVGLAVEERWPFGLVLVTCLAIGVVGGLVNGLIVVRMRVNAFIATLGTGGILSGFALVYSDGAAVVSNPTSGRLPEWFFGRPTSLGSFTAKPPAFVVWAVVALAAAAVVVVLRRHRPQGVPIRRWTLGLIGAVIAILVLLATVADLPAWLGQVSWMILLLGAVAVVLWGLVGFTVFGRHLKATGSNPAAARLAGVHTDGVTIRAFVVGGVLAALSGVTLAATLGSASPGIAEPYLLPAFAAAFVSTVILSNGGFTVWGTLLGGVVVVWIGQGLVIGGVSYTWTGIVNGLVLVLAVGLPALLRRRRT
ncbi:ABC transporter permease [Pseudonocardia pini]|uniref:ABC transporter permease n=1 Tax=Pseudonocardia pini TaxID=2758030 RepID=UPI0015F05BB5|nr:ABC transporter permease [Pseudonocardia pini]